LLEHRFGYNKVFIARIIRRTGNQSEEGKEIIFIFSSVKFIYIRDFFNNNEQSQPLNIITIGVWGVLILVWFFVKGFLKLLPETIKRLESLPFPSLNQGLVCYSFV